MSTGSLLLYLLSPSFLSSMFNSDLKRLEKEIKDNNLDEAQLTLNDLKEDFPKRMDKIIKKIDGIKYNSKLNLETQKWLIDNDLIIRPSLEQRPRRKVHSKL